MTPKEKAKELLDKFHNTDYCGINHFPNKNYCECVEMNIFQAKQCALICVDEIEKSCSFYDYKLKKQSNETFNLSDFYFSTYWQEVKTEINYI